MNLASLRSRIPIACSFQRYVLAFHLWKLICSNRRVLSSVIPRRRFSREVRNTESIREQLLRSSHSKESKDRFIEEFGTLYKRARKLSQLNEPPRPLQSTCANRLQSGIISKAFERELGMTLSTFHLHSLQEWDSSAAIIVRFLEFCVNNKSWLSESNWTRESALMIFTFASRCLDLDCTRPLFEGHPDGSQENNGPPALRSQEEWKALHVAFIGATNVYDLSVRLLLENDAKQHHQNGATRGWLGKRTRSKTSTSNDRNEIELLLAEQLSNNFSKFCCCAFGKRQKPVDQISRAKQRDHNVRRSHDHTQSLMTMNQGGLKGLQGRTVEIIAEKEKEARQETLQTTREKQRESVALHQNVSNGSERIDISGKAMQTAISKKTLRGMKISLRGASIVDRVKEQQWTAYQRLLSSLRGKSFNLYS